MSDPNEAGKPAAAEPFKSASAPVGAPGARPKVKVPLEAMTGKKPVVPADAGETSVNPIVKDEVSKDEPTISVPVERGSKPEEGRAEAARPVFKGDDKPAAAAAKPVAKAPVVAAPASPEPAAKAPSFKEPAEKTQRKVVRVTEEDLGQSPEQQAIVAEVAAKGPGIGLRRTRKARLRLARLDPWSVMKTTLLFSVAFGIASVVAVWVVWGLITASGSFDSINDTVNSLISTPGSPSAFDLKNYVNGGRIVGLTAAISGLNVILMTALLTLFSFLYNLAASIMGGLEVTLAED